MARASGRVLRGCRCGLPPPVGGCARRRALLDLPDRRRVVNRGTLTAYAENPCEIDVLNPRISAGFAEAVYVCGNMVQ